MQFQKGQPRPPNAGRKKGSLNKKKIPKVADFLAEKDVNPAEEILKILTAKEGDAHYEKMSPNAKIAAWMDLLSYCQAKPLAEIDSGEASDQDLLEEFEDVPTAKLLELVRADGAK